MSTLLQVRTRLRRYLRESATVAETWEDDRLDEILNDAIKTVSAEMGQVDGAGWFIQSATFTIAASTEEFDLSGLTGHSSYPFAAIRELFHVASDGREIRVERRDGPDYNSYRRPSGETVSNDYAPVVRLRRAGGTSFLGALPLADGVRTFRLDWRYEHPTLSNDGDALHTPDRYDEYVARLAQRDALEDTGQMDTGVEQKIALLRARLLDREGDAEGEDRPKRIRDDVGSAFSEDPYERIRRY